MIVHLSNLRPVKRIDLLLDAAALVRPRGGLQARDSGRRRFRAVCGKGAATGDGDRVVVRPSVFEIEDYLQAADLALFTSDSESFCLGILEAMWFGCPSVSTAVGGIPEVVETGRSGMLVEGGEPAALARAVESLLGDPARCRALGGAARRRAQEKFSAAAIVPQYEALYARVVATPRAAVLH
jgi:glycosyltransferase involved in cell wall biosynthesis